MSHRNGGLRSLRHEGSWEDDLSQGFKDFVTHHNHRKRYSLKEYLKLTWLCIRRLSILTCMLKNTYQHINRQTKLPTTE